MAIKPNFLASMGYHIFLTMVLRACAFALRVCKQETQSVFFDFSIFSLVFRTSKLLELTKVSKIIIPFALLGYETGYRPYAPRWLFTISYPTRAHGIIINYNPPIFGRLYWVIYVTWCKLTGRLSRNNPPLRGYLPSEMP